MGLIVFGVTYKVFLKGIVKDDAKYESGDKTSAGRMLGDASPEISDQTSAYVFSVSLAVVLLSLELMCLTHSGLKQAFGHLVKREEGAGTSPHWPVVIIALFKVGLFSFQLTLGLWTTDQGVLTICGFCVVLAMSVTRVLSFFFIHKKDMIQSIVTNLLPRVSSVSFTLTSSGNKGSGR